MSLEIAILFAVLAGMIYLFLTETLSVELTAFVGLLILVVGGYVQPSDAFVGFSSSAVITMFSIFFISGALARTGVADRVGHSLAGLSGGDEVRMIVLLMVMAGMLSAFMNNVAAAAVLMPAVASAARLTGLSPSRLFMPLAFGAILGGTVTLVGTPPNILTGEVMASRGIEPFALFDFAPMGLVLLTVGILFMVTLGRRLMPERADTKAADRSAHLARAYRIEDRMTSIRVPEGSVLDGRTLREMRLGRTLDVSVMSVRRGDQKTLAPGPDFRIRAGDDLIVDAPYGELETLLSMEGIAVDEADPGRLDELESQVHGVVLRLVRGSGLVGRSLSQLHFRERLGVLVFGIRRGRDLVRQKLARQVLHQDDEILVLGTEEQIAALHEQKGLEVGEALSLPEILDQRLFVVHVDHGSSLADVTLQESRLGELAGLTILGIGRGGKVRLDLSRDERILPDDELLVVGDPDRLLDVLELGDLDFEPMESGPRLESTSVRVVEAVVAPRSSAVGSSLHRLHFREHYGLQVLALWREGEAIHRDLDDLALQVGDALLLHGPVHRIDELAEDIDFVVLDHEAQGPQRHHKAPVAVGALLVMIAIVAGGAFPIHVAAFTGAVMTVLFGALTMEEAYKTIEWRALFLVAAILPVGTAIESSGAAALLAGSVAGIGETYGPHAFLATLAILASILSQTLDGAPTVVILAPVVVLTAEKLQIQPEPLLMTVGLAASAAFMTPFSQKASLLVMSAGSYRTQDFVRVGTPLTLLVLVLIIVFVPLFFPFVP